MIGHVLGNRYKLIGELGSGGMAWVYLAQDLVDGQAVAVKILYPQLSQDSGFVQRFIREARLSMALSQSAELPNIVCVLDYGADGDTHYLVMEYVPGQDLGKILEERGTLPWPTALDLARQVAVVLDQAHAHGIVHRDIKPSNIMVLPDGTVRVLDLGIARARSAPELTVSGFFGSPHYASPEQVTRGPLNIRADIYSLGVVLYRMLSGRLPFEGKTPLEVVNQQIAAPPPSLAERCPDLPRPVVRLVHKAMAKRPRDRFQTPADLIQAIDSVLAGEDVPQSLFPETEPPPEVEELYQDAVAAMEAERWQEAVDYLSQVVKVDPNYRDVSGRLGEVGRQVRLSSLYRSAQRSLEHGQWDQALVHLDKIEELAPDYKNAAELRARAARREKLPATGPAPTFEFPTQVPAARADRAARAGIRPRRRTWPWAAMALLLLGGVLAALLLSDTGPASPPPTETPGQGPTAGEILGSRPTVVPTLASTRTALAPTIAPSPDAARPEPALAGQIAFPRFDPARETYDIQVCAADGSNCRLVADEASQPSFLPGGTQIVYRSWKPGDQGLVLQTLGGQETWQISADPTAARPSVDFQGSFYVYCSRQAVDRQPRLFRTYSTDTRPLIWEGSTLVGRSPAWTPDAQILYNGCLDSSCGILIAQADGGQPRQLVAGSSELAPETSPNGRQVAFMSRRDGNWEVYVAGLDGAPAQRLTREPGNDGLPAWSPGGRYLAFVSDRGGTWAVWAMRPDGSGQRRLFEIGGSPDGRVRSAAAYEPQGWVEERISWAPEP